ncbi:hypothetical protein CPB84DRAFT_1847365 [Gymnopilus junonius]|uniref:Uncharacterized protein n=1 Tax=Gymnopilus junonius TaxID=109634 RepID=A0A9P5NKJ4_GYMJU|nr:hypothetical protein CPB84DRAFT_1847365 [Gymnopilus junonius]
MEKQAEGESRFVKRLLLLVHRDRVEEALPSLLDDLWNLSKNWGREGVIDPFVEMYDLIFQMTVRVATCREIYGDRTAVIKLEKNFLNLEKTASAFSILFPWFPGPSQLGRLKSLIAIIKKFQQTAQQRRNASNVGKDGIDALIAEGDSDETIAGTLMGFMLAGTVNTGIMGECVMGLNQA